MMKEMSFIENTSKESFKSSNVDSTKAPINAKAT